MSYNRPRPLAKALAEIEAFQEEIKPAVSCERWVVAGSVRRLCPDVGDVDIVAVPKFAEITPEGLLIPEPVLTNMLWARVDDLLAAGRISKHVRDTTAGDRTNWGNITRSIEFRGNVFEVTIADMDNFGPLVAIKTGPWQLSKDLVIRMKRYGYACDGGFHVIDHNPTPNRRMPLVTEAQFFGFCGISAMPAPERRVPPPETRR